MNLNKPPSCVHIRSTFKNIHIIHSHMQKTNHQFLPTIRDCLDHMFVGSLRSWCSTFPTKFSGVRLTHETRRACPCNIPATVSEIAVAHNIMRLDAWLWAKQNGSMLHNEAGLSQEFGCSRMRPMGNKKHESQICVLWVPIASILGTNVVVWVAFRSDWIQPSKLGGSLVLYENDKQTVCWQYSRRSNRLLFSSRAVTLLWESGFEARA